MIINLKDQAFSERFSITEDATNLLENTKDAYQLSMLLLIGAFLGNAMLYNRAFLKMEAALSKDALSDVNQNSFKAWLYGRMLLATSSMQDESRVNGIREKLTGLLQDENTKRDNYKAWAWGYLANLSSMEYQDAKKSMEKAANELTCTAIEANNNSFAMEEEKQKACSEAIWMWVMSAQAAANSNDKEMYKRSLKRIKLITQQDSVADALLTGLLRTSDSNDYPAWALAIIRLAAITMRDDELFNELERPLEAAIGEAVKREAKQEAMLAKVNNELAIVRQIELLSQVLPDEPVNLANCI